MSTRGDQVLPARQRYRTGRNNPDQRSKHEQKPSFGVVIVVVCLFVCFALQEQKPSFVAVIVVVCSLILFFVVVL